MAEENVLNNIKDSNLGDHSSWILLCCSMMRMPLYLILAFLNKYILKYEREIKMYACANDALL